MSLQHAQQLVAELGEVRVSLRYGRFGPRWRGINESTPESRYAAGYLDYRLGKVKAAPKPWFLSDTKAARLRERIDKALERE